MDHDPNGFSNISRIGGGGDQSEFIESAEAGKLLDEEVPISLSGAQVVTSSLALPQQ
jgi:hypothetical protein